MDNIGKIERIDGNKAVISVKRVSACGDSCKSCSSACKVNSVIVETEISEDEDINVGDYVEIKAENEVRLKHIVVLYGLPLLWMIVTVIIVQAILATRPDKDIISAIASLFSLIISFFLLKAYDKREMKKNVLKFTVGKKL